MFGFIWSKVACSGGEYMQQSIKYGNMKYGSAYDILEWDLSYFLRVNVWFYIIKIACSLGEYMQESI